MRNNEFGRSMIEMLGVLAIVGILSVGGIAGFSKAMTKHKLNKLTEEYTSFINDFLPYKESFIREKKKTMPDAYLFLDPYLPNLGIVPRTWMISGSYIYDSIGSKFEMFVVHQLNDIRHNKVTIRTNIKTADSDQDAISVCQNFMVNIVKPYQNIITIVTSFGTDGKTDSGSPFWYGDNYCTAGRNCLRDITIAQIDSLCRACVKKESYCILLTTFE